MGQKDAGQGLCDSHGQKSDHHLPVPDASGGSCKTVRALVPDLSRQKKDHMPAGDAGGRIPAEIQRLSQ